MPEDTIQNYVNRIAELEDQVDKQKEAFRKAIDLNALLANPREYIKNLAMDFYESNEDILREAVDLGEDKAKKILKKYVKTD
tara:strand:+ start:1262 stop:1507 length:246 start_codon:yes stop_codon:yes gene_type:complete